MAMLKGLAKLFGMKHNTDVSIQESVPIENHKSRALAMGYISSQDAATIIRVNDSRVRQLLKAGILTGKKFGTVWLVSKRSAEKYALTNRKRGPKPKNSQRKKLRRTKAIPS